MTHLLKRSFSFLQLSKKNNLKQVVNLAQKFSVSTGKTFEEIRIPVPWGHIAGKWWGPQDKRPYLCIHGWQESCGSFDPLMQLLPKDLGILAIDFPGHGLSSRLPPGLFYHGIDSSILIRRIQNYFNWDKLSLLGHSMGGITSFMFTCLYPKKVDILIAIDALKPFSAEPGSTIENTVKNIEKFLYYDQLNSSPTQPPSYTYEELCKKIHFGSRKSINLDKCEYVLKRCIEPSEHEKNKFHFTRDSRLKVGVLVGIQHADVLEYAKRVECPMLVMKATRSPYFEDKKYFYEVIDVLKKNPNFEYVYVEGTHHVHVNEPEKVASIINNFISKHDKFDRNFEGHSMGGITCFVFTCLYPKTVDILIEIDAVKPFSAEPGSTIENTVKNIEKFLYYDELNSSSTQPPSYTYEELCKKIHFGSRKSINFDKCEYVLKRCIEPSEHEQNKFHFTRDSRLKVGVLVGMQHADLLEYAKRIECPMLVMKATKSSYVEDKKYVYEIVDVLKKNNPNFEYVYVDGTHHVHVNEPQKVAPIINNFINKHDKFDRSFKYDMAKIKLKK